ncbi:hypothetical protein PQY08_003240 [Salmonella enterica]|nr:hypothetical protein [Salmonella enterica]ECD6628635.1 hypothetical protein [Salmonella enterica subsp. enterica serovar Rubislaw]EEG6259707.1 hypothetical protein [Salmonella enterica subsp. enterica]EEJ0271496.1 hypothetical protein [Salmonella enterica subsp. enterica serovar Braenderup]EEN5140984.1 hypothetical protein [Salmonella enterica subsp. enterica serovar Oranienburg]HCK5317663.1 hypothetical protein [Salmonella enterica subsp. enterica serovar Manhattan]HCZ4969612.1 hypothetic
MINPNKSLAQKALAGAQFLRMHAEGMAGDDNFLIALMSEPHAIAASAIEQLIEENEKLREQLVAFQRTAKAAVAIDPASGPDTTACYTPFVRGDRVRLKLTPEKHGTVDITRGDDSDTLSCFVHFVYPPEKHSWVSAKRLELIPDE